MELTEAMASGIIRMATCLGDVTKALSTWDKVVSKGVSRKRRMYAALLELLAKSARASEEADVDFLGVGLKMLSDSLEHKCDLMQEDFVALLQICSAKGKWSDIENVLQTMQETIYALQPETLTLLTEVFESQASRKCSPVTIAEDGQCPSCGHTMQSIDLEKSELDAMCKQINELARVGDKQTAAFDVFKQWVLRQPPVDAIIDGANVGYYSLRPDQGHTLSYSQVDRVIQAFEKKNLRPLVIMHCRHFSAGANMTATDQATVQRWRDKKVLYTTPPKMNDDWFWLYAGVWRSSQPGGSGLVMVSNDQMRDHHFQMLSTRKFLKWRERHWVNFHFDDRSRDSAPAFVFPSKFSIRMQEVQTAKDDGKTDQSRAAAKGSWHVPSADDRTKWICSPAPQ